jgi:hypothetical protein
VHISSEILFIGNNADVNPNHNWDWNQNWISKNHIQDIQDEKIKYNIKLIFSQIWLAPLMIHN